MACATPASSATGARSTSQTPSPYPGRTAAATWRARRVLPIPPGPLRVSSRVPARARWAAASSLARPMKLVSGAGRVDAPRTAVPAHPDDSRTSSVGGPWGAGALRATGAGGAGGASAGGGVAGVTGRTAVAGTGSPGSPGGAGGGSRPATRSS